MIPTKIPKFNKVQTRQLEDDLNRKTTKKELSYWKNTLQEAKKIKVK
jgi:hypothetical protein